jgi:hypothetical protein
MNDESKSVKILPVYTEKYEKKHTLQNIKQFWCEPWSLNTLVRLIKHNRSLKVVVQGLDYYGPPLTQD